MKYVSKYRSLRCVLIPTHKRMNETTHEVFMKPPVVAEFKNSIFDTAVEFPKLKLIQENSGCPERLESEEKLIKLLEGQPGFGDGTGATFSKFFTEAPEDQVKRKIAEAAAIAKEYGIEMPATEIDQAVVAPSASVEKVARAGLEAMGYKELQSKASELLGINAVGKSKQMLVDALEEHYIAIA